MQPSYSFIINSTEERQNVTISNIKCVWCNSNDKDSHELIVADHRIKLSDC